MESDQSSDGTPKAGVYSSLDLVAQAAGIFIGCGLRRADAEIVANSLIRSNLRGNESHGIERTLSYVRQIQSGHICARPDIGLDYQNGTLHVHGGSGLGQLV